MGSQTPAYDYIICGGGNAGCVLASRLAEDGHSVLILEAGGPKASVPASNIPAAVSQILGTEADWQIWSEPNKHLNDRKLHLGRGKFVGGTSGTNGTLCIRGAPEDYDCWGVEGWSGAEMHKYMSKAETFKNKPWFKANDKAHGHSGPLVTAPHDNAPISNLVMESFQSKGLPLEPDMFTTGDVAHGCGHAVRTIYQGLRTTAADFIQGARENSKIKIETYTYVDTVELEQVGGKLKATGVNTVTAVGRDQAKIRYTANKEVILATGAYGTPTVLMRSGVGPAEELAKHNIKPKLELSGVGKNLQDHLVMLLFYEVNKPHLTNDDKLWHGGAKDRSVAQWKTDKTGFMSQFPFGSFAYARLDERLADSKMWQEAKAARTDGLDPMGLRANQPHIEIWNTECYSPKYLYRDFPTDDKHAFAMATKFFSPQSRGQVTLKDLDPTANPVVDHNFLAEPLDMLLFTEAARFANEIAVSGSGTKDVIAGSWPANLKHHAFTTREEWEPVLRERSDTCKYTGDTT